MTANKWAVYNLWYFCIEGIKRKIFERSSKNIHKKRLCGMSPIPFPKKEWNMHTIWVSCFSAKLS